MKKFIIAGTESHFAKYMTPHRGKDSAFSCRGVTESVSEQECHSRSSQTQDSRKFLSSTFKRRFFRTDICLVSLLLLMLLPLNGCRSIHSAATEQQRLTQLFIDYRRQFPAATLKDMYKYSFQDTFGPAHIIQDSLAGARYIESEIHYLDSIGWGYKVLYEPLLLRGQYVRVNVWAVKEGKITTGQLVSALMHSGVTPGAQEVAAWKAQWPEIEKAISQLPQPVVNFAQDSIAIAGVLQKGDYVSHHSASFNAAYHYGYRLIRKDIFEKELLPYLK
jgi:hypothetical protein